MPLYSVPYGTVPKHLSISNTYISEKSGKNLYTNRVVEFFFIFRLPGAIMNWFPIKRFYNTPPSLFILFRFIHGFDY